MGRIESSSVVPRLNLTKEHQVVRLVNATVTKVAFRLCINPDISGTDFVISPMSGIIEPGGFAYVRIRNLNHSTSTEVPVTLDFKYKRLGLASLEPAQMFGKIGIKMTSGITGDKSSKDSNIYCLIFRVFRAALLIALITYNVILIRYEIYRR